jgi:hypothetical protein
MIGSRDAALERFCNRSPNVELRRACVSLVAVASAGLALADRSHPRRRVPQTRKGGPLAALPHLIK